MRVQDLSIYGKAIRTKDGRLPPKPVLGTQSCPDASSSPDATSGLSCPDASSSPDATLF